MIDKIYKQNKAYQIYLFLMASLAFSLKKHGIKHLESHDNVNNVKNYKTHKHKSFIELLIKMLDYIDRKKK